MIRTSVIISFYNRIDYLKLVLAGFERQAFTSFEMIVADDGSDRNIQREIELLSGKIPFKFTHLWQEDNGFRKNKILNRSISAAQSDYLIFIDGDCIPHPEFINEHYSNRKNKVCLTGRRVNLSEKISRMLTHASANEVSIEKKKFKLILDGIFGNSYDVEKGFYFKSKYLRDFFNKKTRGLLGCNFSIHKKDLIKINGFDERYEAPSIGEDTDVQYRLEQTGVKIKSLNNIAIQYHLYHKLQKRPQKNIDLFNEVKSSGQYITSYGIVKSNDRNYHLSNSPEK